METVERDVLTSTAPSSRWKRSAPALTLMIMAPLLSEVLPGATRLSTLFVLPIQTIIWGGGALLIRYAVRRWRLGWLNMLLLALALAVAEECLIQQTSLAPMILQIRGDDYARAFGVNYVYFLWALVYEAAFAIILPVHLVELIFPDRREELWVSKAGLAVVLLLLLPACFLAWFSWTQHARPEVFKVPVYNPPATALLLAIAAICGLVFTALGPFRNALARPSAPLKAPPPWLLGILGALWAVVLHGLVLLAFGIEPSFPPPVAVGTGIFLATSVVFFLPCWTADSRWHRSHEFAVIFGAMLGSMLAGFIEFIFIGALPSDLYFKIVVNLLAVALMTLLGLKIRRQSAGSPSSPKALSETGP